MTTLILAQIIGPVFVAAGVGFLLHPKFYQKILKDFESSEGLTYFTGIFVMALGLSIVLNHNIWEWSAAGLVTVLGWGSLVKGAIFLIVPNWLFSVAHFVYKNEFVMKIAMVVIIVVGAYLAWFGYFA